MLYVIWGSHSGGAKVWSHMEYDASTDCWLKDQAIRENQVCWKTGYYAHLKIQRHVTEYRV